jgi:hypothetical protein
MSSQYTLRAVADFERVDEDAWKFSARRAKFICRRW